MRSLIMILLLIPWSILASTVLELDFGDKKVLEVNYSGFKLYYNCKSRSAFAFMYDAKKDNGNFNRYNQFYTDPDIPAKCQQKSTGTYRTNLAQKYDRGHLVPANHLDHLVEGIKQSNIMTNILPQAKEMNRGAWLETEELIECYRDIEEIKIIGGPVWLNYSENDYFIISHGVEIPEFFWKIVIRNNAYIAWLIPNSSVAHKGILDEYVSTKESIENLSGIKIIIKNDLREITSMKIWGWDRTCDKS